MSVATCTMVRPWLMQVNDRVVRHICVAYVSVEDNNMYVTDVLPYVRTESLLLSKSCCCPMTFMIF